jgi:hypothetical protein
VKEYSFICQQWVEFRALFGGVDEVRESKGELTIGMVTLPDRTDTCGHAADGVV